mgnify:CR=1 FL=1
MHSKSLSILFSDQLLYKLQKLKAWLIFTDKSQDSCKLSADYYDGYFKKKISHIFYLYAKIRNPGKSITKINQK